MTPQAPGSSKPLLHNGLFWLAALLVLSTLVQTCALAFHWGGSALQTLLGDTLNLPPNLLGAVLIGWISRLHQGAMRRAWGWMALALLAYLIGDVVWAYLEVVLKAEPFPSLADVGYVAFPILLGLGLWQLPKTPSSRLENLKLGLDVMVMVAAAGVFAWQAFLAKTIEGYGTQLLPLSISLFYPVTDLALLALLLLLGLRQQMGGIYQLLLGLGLALLILADTFFNVQSATDSYVSGTVIDSLWSWSSVLIGLAAWASLDQRQNHWSKSVGQALAPLSALGTLAPYGAILLTFYLAVSRRSHGGLIEVGVLVGAGVVTLLVVVRQAVAFSENRHLTQALQNFNHQLEQRVQERTRELEEQRERLLASEKLASLGRLTAGIAHEINTPLAASMNHLLQARKLTEEYRDSIGVAEVSQADHREIAADLGKALDNTNASLERMGEFIRKMRAQGRNPEGVIAGFDPVRIARETLALLEPQALEAKVKLELQAPQSLSLHGEAGRFSQVLSNLIQNAIHACENRSDGLVLVEFSQDPEQLWVKIRDNGSGIVPEVLPKIFEPLFTTKPVGKGTGLGLPIIRDIVKGHFGGEIGLETAVGQGTTFILKLPFKTQPTPAPLLEKAS